MLKEYIETNKQRFLNELFELIRIPSVSSKKEHEADMVKAAEKIKHYLLQAGVDKALVMQSVGHPVVYAEKIINPSLPTVLVYGHYDVQPEEPLEKWHTPPFEPTIVDDKIYARGSSDDKGQVFMHIKALEYMNETGTLTCNVKFMLEGEEEIGSPSLEAFCKEHKDLLKCDVILVSDTSLLSQDLPSITVGLRGLAYLEVEVTGPNHDLHSGIFGGAVANPANVLAKMIASLTDAQNRITIPAFYDDVQTVSTEERAEMAKAPFDLDEYKQSLGVDEVSGEEGYSSLERTTIRPTLDVNGIWSGFIGEGSKTVLPSKANAKISMRLVPNQNPDKIAELFEKHFIAIAPNTVKVKVTNLHGGFAYVSPTTSKAYLAASKAYTDTFGKKPIPTRSGGSIPIITVFERVLGAKSILMGFGLESDGAHSPNEKFDLFNFYKGIETIPLFYKYYGEMMAE